MFHADAHFQVQDLLFRGDLFFFFNDTATTEIYTLSLHDALPIYHRPMAHPHHLADLRGAHVLDVGEDQALAVVDRKSTRLNSSHMSISYAVFCLKKKKKNKPDYTSYQKNKRIQ